MPAASPRAAAHKRRQKPSGSQVERETLPQQISPARFPFRSGSQRLPMNRSRSLRQFRLGFERAGGWKQPQRRDRSHGPATLRRIRRITNEPLRARNLLASEERKRFRHRVQKPRATTLGTPGGPYGHGDFRHWAEVGATCRYGGGLALLPTLGRKGAPCRLRVCRRPRGRCFSPRNSRGAGPGTGPVGSPSELIEIR